MTNLYVEVKFVPLGKWKINIKPRNSFKSLLKRQGTIFKAQWARQKSRDSSRRTSLTLKSHFKARLPVRCDEGSGMISTEQQNTVEDQQHALALSWPADMLLSYIAYSAESYLHQVNSVLSKVVGDSSRLHCRVPAGCTCLEVPWQERILMKNYQCEESRSCYKFKYFRKHGCQKNLKILRITFLFYIIPI